MNGKHSTPTPAQLRTALGLASPSRSSGSPHAARNPRLTPLPGGGSKSPLEPELERFLEHLRVERRLATRTLALYHQALRRLHSFAALDGVALQAAMPHHVRGWVAKLRHLGLAPRSIALDLAAWRGLYRWWGRDGLVRVNPVAGVRPPKAAKPLPKALSVDQAVALAVHEQEGGDPGLRTRDHAIAELLYSCGLRVSELLGLDVQASATARGWVDVPDATAHVLGKGAKRRSVPIGAPALAALAAWQPYRAAMASPVSGERACSRLSPYLAMGALSGRETAQATALRQAERPTPAWNASLRANWRQWR